MPSFLYIANPCYTLNFIVSHVESVDVLIIFCLLEHFLVAHLVNGTSLAEVAKLKR